MSVTLPPENSVLLALAGWAQQFDNPPDWEPDVSIESGYLFLEGNPVCRADEITVVSSDVEALFLDTEDALYIVAIEWPFGGQPSFGPIYMEPHEE